MKIIAIFVMTFIASVQANFNLKNPWEGRAYGPNPFRDFNYMEIWKDVVGYEGHYQVSNAGQVKSLKRNIILKPMKSANGYCHVQLCKHGKRSNLSIHRLLAIHFIKNPQNKPHINHMNGIRHDNRPENIEWCTPSENVKHAINRARAMGTYKPPMSCKNKFGADHPGSRPVLQFDINGIFIAEHGGILEAGRITGISYANIIGVCRGRHKTSGGFKWKYKY